MAYPYLQAFVCCVYLAFLIPIIRSIIKAYFNPLPEVPGPLLARFTRFWLLKAIASREFHKINIELHRKYGPVVRIAPNEYSIDDLEASKVIYRYSHILTHIDDYQSPRYSAWGLPTAEPDVFTTLDNKHHDRRRREISPLYHASALATIEHQLDSITNTFLDKMTTFATNGSTFDMAQWLQFYAFDAIGALAFGKIFRFLEQGSDTSGMMATIHGSSRYGGILGVYSEWHPVAFRLLKLFGPSGNFGIAPIYRLVGKAVADWQQLSELRKPLDDEQKEPTADNILSSLLARQKVDSGTFSINDAYYHSVPAVFAGGETTGCALTATLYFLCREPEKFGKLRAELQSVEAVKKTDRIALKEVQNCRYLQAVIKESLRLFAPVGLGLPRVVPKGGLVLAGCSFPEGSIVGINGWVANLNPTIFGADSDSFRPERWLADEEAVGRMEQYLFTFGRGPRMCLGKSIALMELNKLVAEFTLRLGMDFADKTQEWIVQNDMFVQQKNFQIRLAEHKQ